MAFFNAITKTPKNCWVLFFYFLIKCSLKYNSNVVLNNESIFMQLLFLLSSKNIIFTLTNFLCLYIYFFSIFLIIESLINVTIKPKNKSTPLALKYYLSSLNRLSCWDSHSRSRRQHQQVSAQQQLHHEMYVFATWWFIYIKHTQQQQQTTYVCWELKNILKNQLK